PLRIGVYASGPVLEAFRSTAAAAGSVSGHPLEVKRLARGEPAEGVHIVFLPRAMSASAGEVLSYVQGRPVLTVTELDPGGPAGMINFVVVDDKVRFDIVLPPATQSGLKISVRLLSVARRVEGRS
ncbi:MAG: YfiR family protein, partial [Rubrivivax sp.]